MEDRVAGGGGACIARRRKSGLSLSVPAKRRCRRCGRRRIWQRRGGVRRSTRHGRAKGGGSTLQIRANEREPWCSIHTVRRARIEIAR